jgi:hypothetical protein
MSSNPTPAVRPWGVSIQARVSRAGIDTIEEIDYDGEQFTRRFSVVPGPVAVSVLDDQQLRKLLAELRAEQEAAPNGVDLLGLEVFVDLVEEALRDDATTSTRTSLGVAQRYVRQKYPDLVAAGGRLSLVSSPAPARQLPRFDVSSFAVGLAHPITTTPLARRTIIVDRGERQVVLDLDPAAQDPAVAFVLAASGVLPVADLNSAASVAEVVATLAPLDPFWSNPTEGGFQATPGANGTIQAVWSGDRFRYEVGFTKDGAVANLVRNDGRIKPL